MPTMTTPRSSVLGVSSGETSAPSVSHPATAIGSVTRVDALVRVVVTVVQVLGGRCGRFGGFVESKGVSGGPSSREESEAFVKRVD